jgi:hypothetical protein
VDIEGIHHCGYCKLLKQKKYREEALFKKNQMKKRFREFLHSNPDEVINYLVSAIIDAKNDREIAEIGEELNEKEV